jgi:PAS domain S-box-containing protein
MYRAIFEAAPDGVLVVNGEGVIVEANPAVARAFGYDRDELIGRGVDVLVPEGVRSLHAGHRQRYMRSPHARPMGAGLQLVGRRKDGVELPVEISLSPLQLDGETWVIAIVRDVTERKRLRDFGAGALRASEEERQRIARELHDDTAQRLATLLVRLRILERSGYEESDWQEAVINVREELKACADGVRRIARGLRPPELEDAGVVAAVRSHIRAVSGGSGIDVVLDADPIDPLLSADAKLVLYRIVQEAVSNAVRHSRGGRVEVRMRLEPDRVDATVQDDGAGFLPDAVRRTELGGLGILGMQERAGMVGGYVDIESRPGEGTRVRVSIPIEQAREAERV